MIVVVTSYDNLGSKIQQLETLGIKAAGLPISRLKPKIRQESNEKKDVFLQQVINTFRVKNKHYKSIFINDDVSWVMLSVSVDVPIITTSKVSY